MSDEPKETPGQDWSAVASVGTESEATLIVGFLENNGIPARTLAKINFRMRIFLSKGNGRQTFCPGRLPLVNSLPDSG